MQGYASVDNTPQPPQPTYQDFIKATKTMMYYMAHNDGADV